MHTQKALCPAHRAYFIHLWRHAPCDAARQIYKSHIMLGAAVAYSYGADPGTNLKLTWHALMALQLLIQHVELQQQHSTAHTIKFDPSNACFATCAV